jgi:hypothetical protein
VGIDEQAGAMRQKRTMRTAGGTMPRMHSLSLNQICDLRRLGTGQLWRELGGLKRRSVYQAVASYSGFEPLWVS